MRKDAVLLYGIIFSMVLIIPATLYAAPSSLWGTAGESWDPKGRLPDFSYAGYHAGEKHIPTVPVVSNVGDFGARGDGIADDTQAFKAAIAAARNGTIFIPQGRYVINEVLYLDKSDIVLRGEGSGEDGSVLIFNNSLTDMLGQNDSWKWGDGGVLWAGHTDMTGGTTIIGDPVADITNEPNRGDRVLRLSQQTALQPGDYVLLYMTEASDHSMTTMLHNGVGDPELCDWQPSPFRWPVQIAAVSGSDITLAQPLRADVRQQWQPKIVGYQAFEEIGIEHLRIEFPALPMKDHLQEDGYNAVIFKGVLNGWIRDVTVVNADNGPNLTLSKHVTITHVTHEAKNRTPFTLPSYYGTTVGHHGFSIGAGSSDNLLTDFTITRFTHDVTVDGLSSGNVIRDGSGEDMTLDNHANIPFENLFSNIHVGTGTRTYNSGGDTCATPHSGARTTFWNLQFDDPGKRAGPPMNSFEFPQANVIPGDRNLFSATNEPWMEDVSNIAPVDLYQSQFAKRMADKPCPNFSLGNANCDVAGSIDLQDFVCWVGFYHLEVTHMYTPDDISPICRRADFNGDNTISISDFSSWQNNYASQRRQ